MEKQKPNKEEYHRSQKLSIYVISCLRQFKFGTLIIITPNHHRNHWMKVSQQKLSFGTYYRIIIIIIIIAIGTFINI
ncbi:hypothetical protein QR98_0065970 [Sarcoptes scabiei]|uniref:Uncharacterized protein n=1 Tax=Sarcoptes scabiei TaxID=52283 RepID=A0A132AAY5_SARSC|nr:hypothetical protein QR98_0065970 [Sarcoptes scabiei]